MPTATDDLQACIDACTETIDAASRVLARHLGEQRMRDCLKMCLDCVDLSGTAVQMLQRDSAHATRVCEVLLDLCATCADACDAYTSQECRRCAAVCRRTAEACRVVAAAA